MLQSLIEGLYMVQLSRNFTEEEFLHSNTALANGINNKWEEHQHYLNAKKLCETVLQPLRDKYGPIHINSGYRVRRLNKLVGGAPNSTHMFGLAADITPDTDDKKEKTRILEAMAKDLNDHVGGFHYYVAAGFIHVDIRGHIERW